MKIVNRLQENKVNNSFHSLQINLEDNGLGEKDFLFAQFYDKLGSNIYYELPFVKTNFGFTIPDNEEKYGIEKTPHITICYGFNNNIDYFNLLDWKINSFPIKLTKVSSFRDDSKPYDVLIIEVESNELKNLNIAIKNTCNITSTYNEYKPHATIAYVKKGTCRELEGTEINREFYIKKLKFSLKDGPYLDIPLF